jgi:hypothetical protein
MTDADVNLDDWARQHVSHLSVLSVSEPVPKLLEFNLVAVAPDPAPARAVALAWERIVAADGAVGLVVMGRPDRRDGSPTEVSDHPQADPERVANHAIRRTIEGAVPGFMVGAFVVGVALAAWTDRVEAVVGGVLGGGLLGAVAGALLSFVGGTGWGSAFREGFTDPDASEILLTTIHADSADPIVAAARAATDIEGVALYQVSRAGRPERLCPPT